MTDVEPHEGRPSKIKLPFYTVGEEIANAITHGIGALLAIAALVLLIVRAATQAPVGYAAGYVVGYTLFGVSLVLLYLTSTLYHSLPRNGAKRVFASLDHSAIFLLIAGSYSAYCLGPLNSSMGWWLFGTIWALAAVGVTAYSVYGNRARWFTFCLYLVMGWFLIVVGRSVYEVLTSLSWLFLVLGGVFYTVGCVFFAMKKVRWMHGVWHLFVLGGSIMHFFSLYWAF